MMRKMEGLLVVGSLVRYEDRTWFVGMVNDARARLDPVTAVSTISPTSGRSFQSFGGSISVAPNAIVQVVTAEDLTETERIRWNRLVKEAEMAVAAPPVGGQANGKVSLKDQNAARKAEMQAKKDERAAERAAAPKKEKAPKAQNPCKDGCGLLTGGYFYPGHDAKFKSWLLKIERGQMKVEELPESVRQAYKWKKTADGKGYTPTTNYKGEPYVSPTATA